MEDEKHFQLESSKIQIKEIIKLKNKYSENVWTQPLNTPLKKKKKKTTVVISNNF